MRESEQINGNMYWTQNPPVEQFPASNVLDNRVSARQVQNQTPVPMFRSAFGIGDVLEHPGWDTIPQDLWMCEEGVI